MTRRAIAFALATLTLAAGCSSGDDDAASTTAAGNTGAASSSVAPSTTDADAADVDATVETTATTATTAAPTTQPSGPIDGAAAIVVTSPTDGAGERPLLSWEQVDDADRYLVFVTLADGSTYWAWEGTDPQVWFGGSSTEPAADTEGPVWFEPMELEVFAVDAAGLPLAASGTITITP